MRRTTKPKWLLAASALSALAIMGVLATAADATEETKHRQATVAGVLPLTSGSSIPLAVQSAGVEWNGNTYHLVTLHSIQFDLDKTNHLKADIQAQLTTFDDLEYDVSGAVFDTGGELLGPRARNARRIGFDWDMCFKWHGLLLWTSEYPSITRTPLPLSLA